MANTNLVTGKIERKYMAHYVDAEALGVTTTPDSPAGVDADDWYRLGVDLEEYSVELNPDTETGKNILGQSTFTHSGYEQSADADPYYARTDDALFEPLQAICDNLYTGDQCKTLIVEIHLWEQTANGNYPAYYQDCYIVPSSYGGDTSGYQIPFTVNYVGDRTACYATIAEGKPTITLTDAKPSTT